MAKTEQVFAAAGIHLRGPPYGGDYLITLQGKGKGLGHPPAVVLVGGSGSASITSFALIWVYRTVADAIHRTRLRINPSLAITRVQNVVILGGPRDPRLRAAIRHLKPSG